MDFSRGCVAIVSRMGRQAGGKWFPELVAKGCQR